MSRPFCTDDDTNFVNIVYVENTPDWFILGPSGKYVINDFVNLTADVFIYDPAVDNVTISQGSVDFGPATVKDSNDNGVYLVNRDSFIEGNDSKIRIFIDWDVAEGRLRLVNRNLCEPNDFVEGDGGFNDGNNENIGDIL